MKCMILAVGFLLTTSLQAGALSQPEKKEIINEHKVLTGLKATGAAVGAGLFMYPGYRYYLMLRENNIQNVVRWAGLGVLLYPAYELGRKALTLAGAVQAEDMSPLEKTEVEKEHKIVSGLKATGAAAGAGLSLLFTLAFLDGTMKLDEASPLNAGCAGFSAYTAYALGCKALLSAKQLHEK